MFLRNLTRQQRCLKLFIARHNTHNTPISSITFRESPKIHNKKENEPLSTENNISPSEGDNNEANFLVKLKNDPNKFGASVDTSDVLDEGDLEEEKFFEHRTPRFKKLTTKQYANLIKDCLDSGKLKEAIDVLEIKMIKEDQVQPENYIYNLLIGACGRKGHLKKAFSLYNNMKKRGLKVTGGTYTALFNACANSPSQAEGLESARHLRNIMVEKQYEPNDTNYNVMIKAFGRCGSLSEAFMIVDEMMSKRVRISSDTMNFLLQACIEDKESGFRHALLVWRKLMKYRLRPSIYTYNLMLHAIRDCNLGNLEITENVISQIINERVKVGKETNNKLILIGSHQKLLLSSENEITTSRETQMQLSPKIDTNYPNLMARTPRLGNLISISEVKKPEDKLLLVGGLETFLNDMKENGVSPDIKTYSLLLDIIPSTIAAEKQLLVMMRKADLRFDVDFFNMLIKKRIMRQDYENVQDVLKHMRKFSLKPNLFTYGILALCCKTELQALEFIEEMKASKYRLNAEILGALLHQACYSKNFQYVTKIMQICVDENVQPNKKFLSHLNELKTQCRRMIKNKDDELGQSKTFQRGFQLFRLRYSKWLNEIKIDETEDKDPLEQFKEETDPKADKYFVDKNRSSRFKPRHSSTYKVKTSQ